MITCHSASALLSVNEWPRYLYTEGFNLCVAFRCPLQEDTPTTKPTCGPATRSPHTFTNGAPPRTWYWLPTTAPPYRAARGAGAAWCPTTRRATATSTTRIASGDALRKVCTPSSTCRAWSAAASTTRTSCGVLAATRWWTLSTRRRCRARGRVRGARPPSPWSHTCTSSTPSCCHTSRSQTSSVSLKRSGGSRNTKGAAAVGPARPRLPPNQTGLLGWRAPGRAAPVKAAGSVRETGSSRAKRAHLAAASTLRGALPLGRGQAGEAGLTRRRRLPAGPRSTRARLRVKLAGTVL